MRRMMMIAAASAVSAAVAPTLAATLAPAAAPTAAHAQAADPAARARAYDDAVVAVAKARLALPARADAFAKIVRDHYDMAVIAQLVAGPAWSGWSAAARGQVIAALTRHSAVSLARNFDGAAPRFTIDPRVIDRGASQLVTVTVGGDTLVYRMRQGRIVDVMSGGVSQLALQRADLAATVAAGGAAGLVRKLGQLDAVK